MFPLADVTPKLSGRDYKFREPTLRREPTVRSEYLFSRGLRGEPGESQPTESTDDAEASADFLVDPRWFHLSSSQWTSISTLRASARNIPYSTGVHWCYEVLLIQMWMCYKKSGWTITGIDDCVCIEKASQHADTFPKKSKCRRATCSKTRPILTWKINCVHDLWVFPWHQSLWSSTRTIRLVSKKFTECRRRRFRRRMGSCTTICWWNTLRYDPKRIVQVKIKKKIRPTSDCAGFEWSRNGSKQRKAELFKIEDNCKTSYWSDDENSKLQGPERCCGTRISHKESEKKAYVERKVGECFQWKAHGQFSKGDSCSFTHDTVVSGNSGAGQRRKGRSSSPASHSKAKQTYGEGQKSSTESGNKEESSSDKKSEMPCRFKFCKNPVM